MPNKRSRVPLTLKYSTSPDREHSGDSETDVKRFKTVRRHGACNPCRVSKTRCDGAWPCGACRNESRKRKICEYSKQARRCPHNQRIKLPVSTSNTFDFEQEQCGCTVLPSSTQSQSVDQASSSSELNMHKVLLLRRVVDEFVDAGPTKGRGSQQIIYVQKLWSEFMESGMTDAPLAETYQDLSSKSHGDCREMKTRAEQATPQERMKMWQADLDATVQLVNAGKLMQAWNSVATIMREIESFDIEHGPMLRTSEALSESTTSICLRLIDLECALSFFVGGASHLTSWTQGRFLSFMIKQQKTDNHLFAVKTDLYDEIQAVLQTDVSQKEGLWEFLHSVSEMRPPSPAKELIKISLNTKQDDTAGMQELKLISHLCLMILYCRTAVVSGHYAEKGLPAVSGGPSDIVRDLQLCTYKKKGKDCRQTINHAQAVLHAFESLCQIDPEGTAQNWFRLCGALIAAIIVGIAELRGQQTGDEADQDQLSRIKACFEALRTRNTSSPIFDKAFKILRQFDTKSTPAREAGNSEKEMNSSVKIHSSDSTPDASFAESQITPPTEVESGCLPVGPLPADDIEVKANGTLSRRRRRKVTKVKAIEFDVIVPLGKEESFDVNHGKTSITNEHTTSAQPGVLHSFNQYNLNMTGSFESATNTIIDHSLLDGASPGECKLYHLPGETSRPPLSIWGHTPSLPYGDDWYWCTCECCSFNQDSAGIATKDLIPLVGQSYLHNQVDMVHQPYLTMTPTDSFGSCNTMVVDALTQPAVPLASDGATAYQIGSANLDLGQTRASNMATPAFAPELSLQCRRDYDVRVDASLKRRDPWTESSECVEQVQQNSLQCNGFVPYNNGLRWGSARLTQQGPLNHAYEQQYDGSESASMRTPGFDQRANLASL